METNRLDSHPRENLPGIGRVFAELRDNRGRLDAQKVARQLDWTATEIAGFLGVDRSQISRNPEASNYQQRLEELVSIIADLKAFFGDDWRSICGWINAPNVALGRISPKQLILDGKLFAVANLLIETKSGFAL